MKLEYYIKNNYGQQVMYLVSCEMSSYIYSLTGHKTMTDSDMRCLVGLGFKLVQVMQERT